MLIVMMIAGVNAACIKTAQIIDSTIRSDGAALLFFIN